MKRRDIVGLVGVGSVPGLSDAQLAGLNGGLGLATESSAEPADELRLELRPDMIPARTLAEIRRYQSLASAVLSSKPARERFRSDPVRYLQEAGFRSSTMAAYDHEVLVLQALTDEHVLAAALSGSYREFVSRLSELGLIRVDFSSGLKRQLADAMRQNLPEVQAQARALAAAPQADFLQDLLRSQEVLFAANKLSTDAKTMGVVAVPVLITVIVVLYVSVVTSVTVSIMAGVFISIAVKVGVAVSGGHGGGASCSTCHSNSSSTAPSTGSEGRKVDRALLARYLIGRRLLALDPDRLQAARVAVRMARLLKNHSFVLEAERSLVLHEIRSFVEAAEEVGLVQIPASTRAETLASIESLALRSAGLN